MVATGLVRGQREIGINFAEEEPGSGLPIEQVGVLARPTEPRGARQRLFQHRGAVGEHPVAEVAHRVFDSVRELLQAFAYELVIVAAQRVAGDKGQAGLLEHRRHRRRVPGQIIHAHGDHPQSARMQ